MVPPITDLTCLGMPVVNAFRSNVFNEAVLNESEQDANAVLTELDKGLRSCKLCTQCEAIARFPRLFERYPFPILINSCFQKLAEFFLNGSNLLRFWVLRICQKSENHLDKILNIDAFVKRIFMVIHSNDAVARALTLRTLGAVSRLIPEKQQVHHALRRALDSHDATEVEAAIYASGQFASQSRTFAISMCSKISDMLESLQIPVPMKLPLVPVLRYMHHDVNTASLVRKVCLNLLPKYPAHNFVVAILVSLTELSARTMTDFDEQITLLLRFVNDVRLSVRIQALKSISKLADKHCIHAWRIDLFKQIVRNAHKCPNHIEQYIILDILNKFCSNSLNCRQLLDGNRNESLIHLCGMWLQSEAYTTAKETLAVLSTIVTNIGKNDRNRHFLDDTMQLINDNLHGLLVTTIYYEKSSKTLRKIISSCLRIANSILIFGLEFEKMLCSILKRFENYSIETTLILCKALAALCSIFQLKKFSLITDKDNEKSQLKTAGKKFKIRMDYYSDDVFSYRYGKGARNKFNLKTDSLMENVPEILQHLIDIMQEGKISSEDHSRTIEILCAVILQSKIGCFMEMDYVQLFVKVVNKASLWTRYRIARSASRYGQPFMATYIYQNILRNTPMDKFHFFLTSLAEMAEIECILNYGVTYENLRRHYKSYEKVIMGGEKIRNRPIKSLIRRLEFANGFYYKSFINMRATSSLTNPLIFQMEFLKLRAQFLQSLLTAVTIKTAQIIVPPPAIACSLAQNSRDSLQKFGHVTNQLRKLLKELKQCEESLMRLYKLLFDADPNTLEFLEILQYQYVLLAYIIETICYATAPEAPSFQIMSSTPENKYYFSCCKRIEDLCKKMPNESTNNKITHYHLDILLAAIQIIVNTPLCVPRYFFQNQQSTQIKLSVSPSQRPDGKMVSVQSGTNVVVKVEGIIQHFGKKPSLFRSIDRVQLTLFAKLLPQRTQNNETPPKIPNETVFLTQIVKPQREYLSANFLLPIVTRGYWQICLETYIIDDGGRTWTGSTKYVWFIRVLEDHPSGKAHNSGGGQNRRF